MKRLLAVVLGVALLAGGGLWFRYGGPAKVAQGSAPAGAPASPDPPHGIPVKTGTVKVGSIAQELSAVGSLLANEAVMIRPELDGRVVGIHFSEGQPVAKGAKLVSLDSSEIEAQLAGVESELGLNRSRMQRAEELQKKAFISAQALDEARENLNRSLARQAEIRARLDKSFIRAPFEGVAGLRLVSPGAYVKAGQDIARLEGIGILKLDFRVPEVSLGRIGVDRQVELRVDAFPGESFKGTIYAIEPAVDEQTRTVLVRARVPNPGVRLKPGMFARVGLTFDVRDNALLVPEQALVPLGEDRYVFRVVDGKAARSRVELGLRRPGEVQITKGLAANDVIIVDGQLKVQDGTPVTVMGEPAGKGGTPKQAAAEKG
ncbi:MAG TPA: efflux RND transporter periplasmic adaptor subunit [Burkholderiales bacterium]